MIPLLMHSPHILYNLCTHRCLSNLSCALEILLNNWNIFCAEFVSNQLMTQYLFQEASYVTFDLLIPRGTSLGLYGRRNSLPTHTHHNFMEVISGLRRASEAREARSAEVRANVFPFPLLCVLHNTYFYKCFKLKSTEIRSDLVAMLNLDPALWCCVCFIWSGDKRI